MKPDRYLFRRILAYALGLLLLAFAVAFSINSGLGVSPVNSFPYVLSLISHVDLGTCVTLVFALFIVAQILLLRRQFQWYSLFQLAFASLFGYFANFARWVMGDFCLPTYFGRLTMLLASLILIALGISLYVDAKLIPMPAEGLILALSRRTRYPFHRIKIALDCTCVLLAVAGSLVFLGRPEGVQEGTVITALLAGRLIVPAQKLVSPLVARLCFPGERDPGGRREVDA